MLKERIPHDHTAMTEEGAIGVAYENS